MELDVQPLSIQVTHFTISEEILEAFKTVTWRATRHTSQFRRKTLETPFSIQIAHIVTITTYN